MFDPKYALFYDNHTQPDVYDFGVNFDTEVFVREVKRCGVDFLTVHARCNRGFTYYPTKLGTPHPALDRDILGGFARECEKHNIKLAAYLNGGISGIESIQHPEWNLVYEDGSTYFERWPGDPFAVRMCLNSPFRQHLMDMISEVVELYPYISGFFIDCVHTTPCYCPRCKELMKKLGIKSHEELGRYVLSDYCREVGEHVFKLIPDGELFFNTKFCYPGKYDTFYDCECLPTSEWGYECLPTLVHWVPELRPGKPVFNMTGRFYDWGDFGGLRTVNSLAYDLFYGLMYGLRPEIGGHFNPKGDLDQPVFDRIAETYDKLREFEPYYTSAPRNNDIAIVLSSEEELYSLQSPLRGAVRMLEELKLPFSVITNADRPLDSFKLIILPENSEFPEHLVKRLDSFKGGVIACGTQAAKQLGGFFGVEYVGKAELPCYYEAPGMPLSIYSGADKVKVLPQGTGAGALIKPYCSAGFKDGMVVSYFPPEKATEFPFEVTNQNRLFCAGHIFSGSYERGADHLRDQVAEYISRFIAEPQLKTANLYSFTRVSLAEEADRKIVSILNYVPEARGKTFAVEDEIELHNAEISVRLDGFEVDKVLSGSDRREIDFTVNGNYCEVKIPDFKGFTAIELVKKL